MLLPLVALPYLARVLGAEAFGRVMYLNVISVIVCFVLDWGFLQGGVRQVARNRENDKYLAEIWSNSLFAKAILILPLGILLLVYMHFFPHPVCSILGFLGAFLAGIAKGFSPLWFFQGLGNNTIRKLAICDIFSSVCLLVFTFIFIQSVDESDLYLVFMALCKGSTYLYFVLKTSKKFFITPSLKESMCILNKTKVFMLGGVAGQCYSNWAYIALGSFLSVKELGLFLTADKIIRATISLNTPVVLAIYPEICALQSSNYQKKRQNLQKTIIAFISIVSIIYLFILNFFAEDIMYLAVGTKSSDAILTLRIMSLFLPLLSLNIAFSQHLLVPMGSEKIVTLAQCCAASIGVPIALILSYLYKLYGALSLPLLAEGIIFVFIVVIVIRKKYIKF